VVEEVDHVFCGSFLEDLAACHESAVVVEDGYEPSWAYEFQVALPEAVRVHSLPTAVGSLDSRLG
jgi:hypothetical protein